MKLLLPALALTLTLPMPSDCFHRSKFEGPVTSYEYCYNATMAYPLEYYRLETTEEGVARLGHSKGENEIIWIKVDQEVFDTVADLIRQYKLYKLKRDYEPPFEVLDGRSWYLHANNGKDGFSSSGYNAWPPKKLREGIDAVNAYLKSLIDAATPDDIIATTLHWEH